MTADEPLQDDADQTLNELAEAASDAIDRCYYRTASRLAAELKRRAVAERRLHLYITALHILTNNATSLLDPEPGREAAIELIAVLESEDRARQIQPDVDADHYEHMISQVSSCAYDNLGKATALSRGFNSEGVHDTIAEGIQVCRRTGKLECIHCFRAYANKVFSAADDLDIALHHARHIVENGNVREGFDQRWSGAWHETRILLLAGRLDAAETAALQARGVADSYHNPLSAHLSTNAHLETIRLLKGEPEPESEHRAAARAAPPADEYPENGLRDDLLDALRSCLRGDHAAAISTLTDWDRRLTERQCLSFWFEVRLRLVAVYRIAGDDRRAEALARPLEARAREARDWTTLRRLARLLDPGLAPSPIAPLGPIILATAGAAGTAPAVETGLTDAPEGDPGEASGQDSEPTPLEEALDALTERLEAELGAEDAQVSAAFRDDLLGVGPDRATHPTDVARLLKLGAYAADAASAWDVWQWAEAIAAPFPRDPIVLNVLAALGDTLRNAEGSEVADRIDAARIERLFRESLDLDPNNAGNFGRAAVYHDREGRASETERCLARVLRLDRRNTRAALWLSQIYRDSDRAHDALAVLDLALRAGSDSPEVAWQAATLAHVMEQFEAALTYLDRFETFAPGRPWTNFYRASSLLRLERPAEALPALDEEERRGEPPLLHVAILRACAAAALDDTAGLRTRLGEVLETRLADVTNLTHSGLVALFERLWNAACALPDDDPLRAALDDRLLATGLAPNILFESPRRANPKLEGLNLYVCVLDQPLDDRWRESSGCLAREEDWTAYQIPWCVLAADEDEAARVALAWQARCYPLPANVAEVQPRDDGYTDHPGVVWQGLRQP